MSEYVFKLPDLGEGTVESEIAEWNIKVGDSVSEEDIVGTMMTDKAAVELSSPVTGKVIKLAGNPGDTIAVGAPLVVFETEKSNGTAETAGATAQSTSSDVTAESQTRPDTSEPQEKPHPVNNSKAVTSPAIRRRAKEAGVDLSAVPGSGANGRILRQDFDAYLQQKLPSSARRASDRKHGATEIKVIGLRRIIAERMSQSKREIPHFSYVEEIDITELEALRQHLNDKRNSAAKLTLLPFVAVALVKALDDFPQCNTTYDDAKTALLRHEPVHLGIATQTPDGLKVPVVKNAEAHGIDALAAEIRRVTEAARSNKSKRDELRGSTITLTSLGKLGGIASTPVINQPEVAIVGVNRAVERPVIVNGQITVRLMMNLSSSFDHRFVDGHDAASMIQRMRELLEHPAQLFMTDH